MKKPKLFAVIAVAAITISISGTVSSTTVAAEPAPRSVWQKVDFELGKSMKLTAAQKKAIQKKAPKSALYTRFMCDVIWSESLTAAEIKKAKSTGNAVCKFAKGTTKNLALEESIYEADEDLSGKKFRIWIGFTEPRQVSFLSLGAYTGALPSDSKFLKYNSSFTLPNPQDLDPSGGEFAGWSTEQYGEGRFFAAGSKVKVKKPLSLYPVWVGHSIQVNILNIDTTVGNQIGLGFTSPGDMYRSTETNKDTAVNVTRASGKSLMLKVPGYADETSFSVSNGMAMTDIGWGTCPYLGFVADKCTVATFSYTGDGSITFNHFDQE